MYFPLLGGGMWLTLSIVCLLIAIRTLKRSDSLTLRSLQFFMLCLVATFMGIVGLAHVSPFSVIAPGRLIQSMGWSESRYAVGR
jgi:hypothetical protein